MSTIKTWIVVVATASLLVGCVGGMSSEEKQQAYQQAIAGAKQAYEKVLGVGYAWRDTAKLMKEAEKTASEGELEKATDLAVEARKQSELAYNQYQNEKNAGEIGIR